MTLQYTPNNEVGFLSSIPVCVGTVLYKVWALGAGQKVLRIGEVEHVNLHVDWYRWILPVLIDWSPLVDHHFLGSRNLIVTSSNNTNLPCFHQILRNIVSNARENRLLNMFNMHNIVYSGFKCKRL